MFHAELHGVASSYSVFYFGHYLLQRCFMVNEIKTIEISSTDNEVDHE